jgi:hypothetical protein
VANDELELLKVLDEKSMAARRRAVFASWIMVAAALAVLAAIIYMGARQINAARRNLESVQAAARVEEGKLQAARAEQQTLSDEIAKLKPLVENYRESAARESTTALNARGGPTGSAAKLTLQAGARVYLQIVDPRDRDYADRIGADLTNHDFKVMGVEYVKNAARLKNTEVRYYKRSDQAGAERLLDVLHAAGARSATLLYLGLENNANVRPNHYEVWFAAQNPAL